MLRLLKLAKNHLFSKAHATAAIKCERGPVKDPPLEITAPVSKSDPPHAFHQATHPRVAWNKGPHRGTITSRSTAVCIVGILFPGTKRS